MQRLEVQLAALDFNAFFEELLRWYDQEKRTLPWRMSGDPYRIWLSEVMLQQTRVETVIPYYERFVAAFPTLASLADAQEDAVLALWQGLGYYSRARNLLRGARWLQREHQGVFPVTAQALQAVPGIGPYTAGAILSMAFNQPVPAMDGNLCRVFGRLWQLDWDMAQSGPREALAAVLTPYWEAARPGDANQALMDLASSVCTVNNPFCEICPLARFCQAKQQGTTANFPVRKKKKASPVVQVATAVLCQDGRCLVAKRGAKGLLSGLWEFISAEGESPEAALANLEQLLGALGLEWEKRASFGRIKHVFTHRVWELQVFRLTPAVDLPEPAGCAWVPLAALDATYLMAGPHRKIAAWVKGEPC